jgi:hypothetical protein
MRFHNILALGSLTVGLITIGSCAIPQAPVECNTAAPMFAFYTFESGTAGSTCSNFGGDYFMTQRYLPPNSTDARLGILPASGTLTSVEGRETTDDSDLAHEAAIGHFKTLSPDDTGVCDLVNVTDGYETYALIPADPGDPDGGVDPTPEVPELSIRHAYEGVRVLSTAQIPGTLMDGHVTITQDGCTAKYQFYAVYPVVTCQSDTDCDPNADPANGRATGSGMNPFYAPHCRFLAPGTVAPVFEEFYGVEVSDQADPADRVGICFPADDKTIDALLKK